MARKRTFKVIIKLTQDALKNISSTNNWVEIPTLVEQVKSLEPALDIKFYGYDSIENAIKAINGGWIELKDEKIRLGKQIN
ncbi:hypothetical protein [Acinetobacter indicus]|nr:hypothetical protein [Acinetobacter indicus]